MRVIFFGLYTPLQGTPTIGRALALLAEEPRLEFTLVGTGQDHDETRELAAPNPNLTWVDWVDGEVLPDLVAAHHICLGIFGTGPKAQRVLPNKVIQGATAGCAIVTSDTRAQRRALGDQGCYVPPGDHDALAAALRSLANDGDALADRRAATRALVDGTFTPAAGVRELDGMLRAMFTASVRTTR